MIIPTDSEYNEAIQNPSRAFSDPDLRAGQPEIISTNLPLPKARSGNFATVYRMNCGARSWAVRCFTRKIHPDQKQRYAEISEYLDRSKLKCAVGFTFIQRGIQVGGEWLPILKMEWLNGESLVEYIERNLHNPKGLDALAVKWVDMVFALRKAGIAHGDLQHGNVLIVGGELRLIDYDGMFVPTLRGRISHESGHPNYQHPQRGGQFNSDLDNFSAWAILISILAVASDPTLWKNHNGGDDCLLFRRKDFAEPDKSPVLRALQNAREPRIQSIAALFRTFIDRPADQVPPIDDIHLQNRSPGGMVAPNELQDLPDWVRPHLRPLKNGGTPEKKYAGEHGSSWIQEVMELPAVESVQFAGNLKRERLTVAFGALLVAAVCAIVAMALATPLLLVSVPILILIQALWIFVCYRRDPSVLALTDAREQLIKAEKEMAHKKELLADLQARTLRGEQELTRVRQKHTGIESEIQRREATESALLSRKHQAEKHQLYLERLSIGRQEAEQLTVAKNNFELQLASLQRRMSEVSGSEQAELDVAMRSLQQKHLTVALDEAKLLYAEIPGVKAALKEKLRSAGINTAADIISPSNVQRVRGIGAAKANALDSWRSDIVRRARASMPGRLPPSVERDIRSKYGGQRQGLESEILRVRSLFNANVIAIKEQAKKVLEINAANNRAADDIYKSEDFKARERFRSDLDQAKKEGQKECSAAEAEVTRLKKQIQDGRSEEYEFGVRHEKARRKLSAHELLKFRNYALRLLGIGQRRI
jgi:hypothetical protein